MNKWVSLLSLFVLSGGNLSAGPGGSIAKQLFETPAGKILGVLLGVVFLPLIVYLVFKEDKAVRLTKARLRQLAKTDYDHFDLINLTNRITDAFHHVHDGWSTRNLDDCVAYMTDWYRQNQQTVYLDRWDERGLLNVCTIERIDSVKPIHLRLSDRADLAGSRIMFVVTANMEDYLVQKKNSSVIEGNPGFHLVETVWTLQLNGGRWLVDNIEPARSITRYTKMTLREQHAEVTPVAESKRVTD